MAQYTKEQLEELYKKLPEELKSALFSADIAEKIFTIGRKLLLTIEEIGFIGEEVGYFILGLTKPRDFVEKLNSRLDLDEEEAAQLAKDINRQIFLPIRDAFRQAHGIELEGELMMRPTPPLEQRAPTAASTTTPSSVPPAETTRTPALTAAVPPVSAPRPPEPIDLRKKEILRPSVPAQPAPAPRPSPFISERAKPLTAPMSLKESLEEKLLPAPPKSNTIAPQSIKEPVRPSEPFLRPSAPSSPKSVPIDLRSIPKPTTPPKPEIMREVIFAAGAEQKPLGVTVPNTTEQKKSMPPEKPTTPQPPVGQSVFPAAAPRTAPNQSREPDPYREPIE